MTEKLILYIGGLDDSVTEKILHSAFVPFGEIKSVEVPIDFTTRKNKILLNYRKTQRFWICRVRRVR
jgi:RNA recognition motif-containing protein